MQWTEDSDGVARLRLAYRISPAGAERLSWTAATAAPASPPAEPPGVWTWLHFARADAAACAWIRDGARLSDDLQDALIEEDTQPRSAELDDGVLLILRGPNKEARSETDELVSLRIFATESRVITVRVKPFAPIYALAERVERGRGPKDPGAFLDQLVETTLERLEARLDRLGLRVDAMEELALAAPAGELHRRRAELNDLKRAIIIQRRYLQPQREALSHLAAMEPSWLHPRELPSLREAAAQAGRMLGDFDNLRDRLTLIGEEMHARMAERMNRAMLTLAVVSTVFMPLTFLTGMLGVNLAGIPFAGQPWAFGALTALLIAVAAATVLVLMRINRP